jgi:tetrahydromethanopterin S-methyltransferase subunit B
MRKLKSQQLFASIMDFNQGASTERANIRADFVKKEIEFQRQDVEDLKNTLDLNKSLINSLISNHNSIAEKSKGILLILNQENQENQYLQNSITLLKSQRDHYHTQCLILKQMVEDMKIKHFEEQNEHKVKVTELLESLDNKEYILQEIQHKFNELVDLLRKTAKNNSEIASLLWNVDITTVSTSGRISNVIKQNKLLLTEMSKIKEKVKELEGRVSDDTKEDVGAKGECYVRSEERIEAKSKQWSRLTNSVVGIRNEEEVIDIELEKDFEDISCILSKRIKSG